MDKRTSLKRTLLLSVMAMLICAAMLAGTTFAWFTDSASTGVNKIAAGNLDIELEYSYDMVTWKNATADTKLFNDGALWEPGHTELVYLRIANKGSLALKYETEFGYNYRVTRGKSVLGNYYYVGDYLKVGVADTDAAFATREDAWAAVAGSEKALQKGAQLTEGWTVLKAGESTNPCAVVIYMPTSVGNEANAKSKSWISTIYDLGLEIRATQADVESDSFDNTYDRDSATILHRIEYSSGTHEVTGNIQADGGYGAIHAAGTAVITINAASVYAVESSEHIAMAVYAGSLNAKSKIIINSGTFAQQITGTSNQYDLIYADSDSTIEINGGTFKSVTQKWTLNCEDGSNAVITVKGGRFYKYNPATDATPGEVVVPDGYEVIQDGDWFVVQAK